MKFQPLPLTRPVNLEHSQEWSTALGNIIPKAQKTLSEENSQPFGHILFFSSVHTAPSADSHIKGSVLSGMTTFLHLPTPPLAQDAVCLPTIPVLSSESFQSEITFSFHFHQKCSAQLLLLSCQSLHSPRSHSEITFPSTLIK